MNIFSGQSVPYPDIEGIIKNPMFLNDISSSRLHELGDVSDYIYFSLMLKECYPLLSELFEKMALTEMRHFGILGKMTIALGGDPAVRVKHSNPYYGKPECLDRHTVKRIVSSALEGEQTAVKRYTKLANAMSSDKTAAALLLRIAADEEHHARMLSRALDDPTLRAD